MLWIRITAMKMTRSFGNSLSNLRADALFSRKISQLRIGIAVAITDMRSSNLQPSRFTAEPEIARQVLNYFVRNPRAADTLEGIARWRLLEEQLQNSLRQTDAAITWLVEQGYLEVVQPVSSVRLYRLDPLRQKDALHFLSQ